MKLSFSWKGFDYFNSSENVLNSYCLNPYELQFFFFIFLGFVCLFHVISPTSTSFDTTFKIKWMWKTDNRQTIPRSFWMTERGTSLATNATTQAIDLAIREKNLFWFIVVRSLLLAHVVITLPQHPLPSRATWWIIPEEKPYRCKQYNYSFTWSSHLKTHAD